MIEKLQELLGDDFAHLELLNSEKTSYVIWESRYMYVYG